MAANLDFQAFLQEYCFPAADPRNAIVLEGRSADLFGYGTNSKTLATVAKEMGVTQERARQIVAKKRLTLNSTMKKLTILANQKVVVRYVEKDASETSRNLPSQHLHIDSLLLAVRPYNCLRNEGINSVQQILEMSDTQLLQMPNMGRKSLNEIRAKVAEVMAANG